MRDLQLVVVEDDPVYQEYYLGALQPLRCHLSFCHTLSLAVSLSEFVLPDAIIVDLFLPDGDGVKAITEILDQISAKVPYIIVVTGSTDEALHQRALKAGANKILVKPISESELISTLEMLAHTES